MKNLSKEQQQEIDSFVAELDKESEAVDKSINVLNDDIGDLNDSIQKYNNVLKNARDFRDGVVQKMKDHFEKQTEDWQEGDEGETYQGWIDAWEEVELASIDLIEVPEIEDREHSAVLSDLSPSCE